MVTFEQLVACKLIIEGLKLGNILAHNNTFNDLCIEPGGLYEYARKITLQYFDDGLGYVYWQPFFESYYEYLKSS